MAADPEQELVMCAKHEMRDGRPDRDCPACQNDPHTHHGERSDVRAAARSRMAKGAGRDE